MQPEIERRRASLELRATEAEGGPPRLEGYAAVFNSPSEELGLFETFREVVMPGAFDRALAEGHDVRALVNHDPNQLLGRTKTGTLRLSVDEHGLRAVIEPPDTGPARDAVSLVRRGDLDGMSFAFRTITDNWRTEESQLIRELHDVELVDVSVVAFPAYSATQVAARALELAGSLRHDTARAEANLNAARQRLNEA